MEVRIIGLYSGVDVSTETKVDVNAEFKAYLYLYAFVQLAKKKQTKKQRNAWFLFAELHYSNQTSRADQSQWSSGQKESNQSQVGRRETKALTVTRGP